MHPQAADVQDTHVAEQAPAEQIAAENGALQLLHAQEDSTASRLETELNG